MPTVIQFGSSSSRALFSAVLALFVGLQGCSGSPVKQGEACLEGSQCGSGFCSNGVCCDTACEGSCNACNLEGSKGVCTRLETGAEGYPSCAPYVCSNQTGECMSSCSADVGCAKGFFCNDDKVCVKLVADGEACSDAAKCSSGFCVDGFCCNTACDGSCDACDVRGAIGTCTVLSVGSVGNPACAPYLCTGETASCPTGCTADDQCAVGARCDNGECKVPGVVGATCGNDTECGSGHCVDGVCCTTACEGACDSCNITGSIGTCMTSLAGDSGAPSCAPYVCSGKASVCPASCSDDHGCADGNYCTGGRCVPVKANGLACVGGNSCASGNCVDGVCCDVACEGACDACNVFGHIGACTSTAEGSAGAPSCAPFVCSGDASACPSGCSDDANCSAGNYCDGTTCLAKKINGGICAANHECSSGNCVDGVCCNTACDGGCDACNLAGTVGQCKPVAFGGAGSPSCSPYLCNGTSGACPTSCSSKVQCVKGDYCNGTACVPEKDNGDACGNGSECASGFCADGVCCSSACGGACDSCNLPGSEGTCAAVAARSPGSPVCSGRFSCDGQSSSCPTRCDNDNACDPGSYCSLSTHTCVAVKANKLGCGGANECASGFCSDGVCCNTACDGACDACNLPGVDRFGVCTVLDGTHSGNPSCSPFMCSGTSGACGTACTSNANCASGAICHAGVCEPLKDDGAVCDVNEQCKNSKCIDGVCCHTSCDGDCNACNLTGHEGVCTNLDARTASTCGGGFACDGASSSCAIGCSDASSCKVGYFCDTGVAGGNCAPLRESGQSCSEAKMCLSGFCADGVCCNAACDGACDRCDIAVKDGTTDLSGVCSVVGDGEAGSPVCAEGLKCGGVEAACVPFCSASQTFCSGACYDTSNDPAHCGDCSTVCADGEVCSGGACASSCASNETYCGGACSDTQVDENHCGGCGNACAGGETCVDGTCTLVCGSSESICGSACVDVSTDEANCGSCSNACAGGETCVDGACTLVCGSPNELACGGTCLDVAADASNCGACGNVCAGGKSCVDGVCACGSVETDCDGVCVDTTADSANCGSCGNVCADGEVCSGGSCSP